MSKTRRKHLPPAKRAKRGPHNKVTDERAFFDGRATGKPAKQVRTNERIALRRDYL